MTRNQIPRTRDGNRDWHRLDANERRVLASIYRRPVQTAAQLAVSTGLSEAQVDAALAHLTDTNRGHALGCAGPVLQALDNAAGALVYRVSAAWERTGRAPSSNRPTSPPAPQRRV